MSQRLTLLAVFALGLSLGIATEARCNPIKIKLEQKVGQWRVEQATGRIFVSLPGDDEVVEYDPASAKEVRRFKVAGGPTELIVKGQWLVAACPKTSALTVIDLKTNEVAGSVPLGVSGPSAENRGPRALFCSGANNPYVYAIRDMEDSFSRGSEVVQVDLANRQVRARTRFENLNEFNVQHVAMSQGGDYILPNSYGERSGSNCNLMLADEEACTFAKLAKAGSVSGQVVADPSGRWWTIGASLFPLDRQTSASRRFAGAPVAIHPALDLAVSQSQTELFVETFSDARVLKIIDLVTGDQRTDRQAVRVDTNKLTSAERARRGEEFRSIGFALSGAAATLQYDLAGGRVVCGLGQQAYIVALADLGIAPESRLAIQGPSRVSATMNRTCRIPLGAGDAKESAKTTLKISSGPAFAKIEGSELVLSPDARSVGKHEIVVSAARGALGDSLKIAVTVGVPSVPLPFTPFDVAADRSGKCAVVWGMKAVERQSDSRPNAERATMFSVIDLDTLKASNVQSTASGIQNLVLDDKYAYLTLVQSNVLYRVDLADPAKKQLLYLDAAPKRLAILPDKQHVAVMVEERVQMTSQVFDRETLKRNPKHYGDRAMGHGSAFEQGAMFWHPAGDGALRFCERILDAQTGTVRCLLSPVAMPRLVQVPPSGGVNTLYGVPMQRRWGRGLSNELLCDLQAARVATLPEASEISLEYPLAVSLNWLRDANPPVTNLEFRSLRAGQVERSAEIEQSNVGLPSHTPYGDPRLLCLAASKVLILRGNKMFVCPIPGEICKDLPIPLMLKYPKVEIASVDKPVTVQLAVMGGEGAPAFSLTKEYEGLTIGTADGKVTLDMPRIWEKYLEDIQKPSSTLRNENMSYQMRGEAITPFERLMGEKLPTGKLAFSVPVEVAVSDQAGARDSLAFSVIVLAPTETPRKVNLVQDLDNVRRQALALQENLERQAQLAAARQAAEAARKASPPPGTAKADMGELEGRIRRLESAFDNVLQRIDRIERAIPPQKAEGKTGP